MFYRQLFRSFCSASTLDRTSWNPAVSLSLDHPTLLLLERCSETRQLKQILAKMIRENVLGKAFPMSRLLYFSAIAHPENIDLACILFDNFTPYRNLYIYNIMIAALCSDQSFVIYNSMLRSRIYPDKHTLLHLLKASKCSSEAKQLHAHAIIAELFSYDYFQNTLVKVYLQNGQLELAYRVFRQKPDVVSYNIMIIGFAKMDFNSSALILFSEMISIRIGLDGYTILGALKSCGGLEDLKLGKSIHAWIERNNFRTMVLSNALLDMYVRCKELSLSEKIFDSLFEKDCFSWNTMISAYAKVGDLETANKYFMSMPCRDIVSWNALISGYALKGSYGDVCALLNAMIGESVHPDKVTLVNMLSTTAEMGELRQGREVHGWIIRIDMKIDSVLASALIDMYCKRGTTAQGYSVFQGVPVKDVLLWTVMMSGFAFHGFCNKAVELFYDMSKTMRPNEVTFISVLSACSHGGFVDKGLEIFTSMKEYYGIDPKIEHYGCLVDLLGRSGKLHEAKDVIYNMPMKPSKSIWGSLLSSSRAHGDSKMAELASSELLDIDPEEEGGYILLSNCYVASERWNCSDTIRETMGTKRVKKTAGCSSINR